MNASARYLEDVSNNVWVGMGLGQKWLFLLSSCDVLWIISKRKRTMRMKGPGLLWKILPSRKALLIELISMDRMGSYCIGTEMVWSTSWLCHLCRLHLHSLLDCYAGSASKAVCKGEFISGVKVGAERRSESNRECKRLFWGHCCRSGPLMQNIKLFANVQFWYFPSFLMANNCVRCAQPCLPSSFAFMSTIGRNISSFST